MVLHQRQHLDLGRFDLVLEVRRRGDTDRLGTVDLEGAVKNFMQPQIIGQRDHARAANASLQFPAHGQIQPGASQQHGWLLPFLAAPKRRP